MASSLGIDVDSTDFDLDALKPLVLTATFCNKELSDVSHVVSFHSRNQRARQFVKQFEEQAGRLLDEDITAVRVDGTMAGRKREELMKKALEDSPKSVIANCKLLSTGVNVPKWDLVYMADPVRSRIYA